MKSCRKKLRLYKKFLKNPSELKHTNYKRYRNTLTKTIRIAKQEYYTKKINDNKKDSKKLWHTLNEVLGRTKKKSNISSSFVINDGCIVNDPSEIANEFNQYFVSIGAKATDTSNIDVSQCLNYLKGHVSHSMYLKPVEEYEIIEIVRKLKQKKSPGHDSISTTIVQQNIDLLLLPLHYIFNLSFESGQVPQSLKLAKVSPIFKKGSDDQFVNYRPVSVLPVFSKILERLFYTRLVSFLEKNSILSNFQYGFRTGHSTILAVTDFLDQVVNALDNKKHTIGLYLDISKAFDCINHQLLLAKLKFYGIRGLVLDWIKDYLKNRRQFVNYNGVFSDELQLLCGIPQGSILGPLFFLIYINDLPNISEVLSYIIFADDTNVFLSDSDLTSLMYKMNIEINKVFEWFKVNGLRVNLDKTNFMHFTTQNTQFNSNLLKIKVANVPNNLTQIKQVQFLGLTIDEKLTWSNHINILCSKIARVIGVMSKLKFVLPSHALLLIYNSLILPHLSYGNMLWASSSIYLVNRIFLLQKRALRVIAKIHHRAHTSDIFLKYNVLTVYQLCDLQLGEFMFKYTKKSLPQNFSNWYMLNDSIHDYNTRSAQQLHSIYFKTALGQKSIRYRGQVLWNGLSNDIKNSASLQSFKRNFKKHLLLKMQLSS